ncbi:hypothetical protein RFI_31425 [Reticulomyxa filosa]|uniref:Uncharacterized protein n=1 Tax=Reticulomyxa filosa TaxID=46433 RepID=X6LXA2_RETFI|nr:hypothetical protein RFI_31425 [Reticulomyxa filosa]|eukprot:ETO05971.1 hypothetical protein RFI_31425 [Reticulomyxa filosa]
MKKQENVENKMKKEDNKNKKRFKKMKKVKGKSGEEWKKGRMEKGEIEKGKIEKGENNGKRGKWKKGRIMGKRRRKSAAKKYWSCKAPKKTRNLSYMSNEQANSAVVKMEQTLETHGNRNADIGVRSSGKLDLVQLNGERKITNKKKRKCCNTQSRKVCCRNGDRELKILANQHSFTQVSGALQRQQLSAKIALNCGLQNSKTMETQVLKNRSKYYGVEVMAKLNQHSGKQEKKGCDD